ncbi:Transposable element Tc1 transposase [Cucumispora dikerogammari]|nr:Transposable element Tc1 transposase [Cucumispora dikerogammari]
MLIAIDYFLNIFSLIGQDFKQLTTKFLEEILKLSQEGFSIREISKKKSLPKSTISYHLIKYKKYLSMGRVSGSCRRSSLNNEEKKVLVEEIHKNPKISANKLKNMVRDSFDKSITDQTIRNTLKSSGFNGRVARKVLCLSSKNVKNRFEYLYRWSSWTLKKFISILYSDENKFNLFRSEGNTYV